MFRTNRRSNVFRSERGNKRILQTNSNNRKHARKQRKLIVTKSKEN